MGQVQLSVPAIRQQPGPAWSERTQTRRGDGQVSFLFHIKPTAGDCWPKDHQQSRLTDATTPPLRAWAGRGGAHSLHALLPGARCRGENQCQPREQHRPCAHRPGLLGGCVAVGKSGSRVPALAAPSMQPRASVAPHDITRGLFSACAYELYSADSCPPQRCPHLNPRICGHATSHSESLRCDRGHGTQGERLAWTLRGWSKPGADCLKQEPFPAVGSGDVAGGGGRGSRCCPL